MEKKGPIRYKHTVNSGDLVANMAAMRHVAIQSGRKAIIYQQLGVEAIYYPGATHPVLNADGKMVTMNQKQFDLMRPLIMAQPWVEDFLVFEGQEVDVDLGKMRGEMFLNIPYMSIQLWPSLVWPDMCPDLTQSWIEVPDTYSIAKEIQINAYMSAGDSVFEQHQSMHGKVIINFTDRYRNSNIHYFWLKDYQEHLVFAGTAEENQRFCDRWKINMPYLHVDNFLELAQALKVCKFFMGNQSMCWGIADAIKIPRILEYCTFVPNCTWGLGPNSYGYLYQQNAEYYFKTLLKS